MFSKVLIANRGEIALRVIRTLKELGIATRRRVLRGRRRRAARPPAPTRRTRSGPRPRPRATCAPTRSSTSRASAGVEAIHPGYGFLAENAAFARACADAGVVFIGPPPEAIEAMGSKIRARETMRAAGVPIVPGTTEPVASLEAARRGRRARSATRSR